MFGGIPFEHFARGGGFGGGPPSSNGSSGPPDTTKLYETLEVNKEATQKEIKKAYFRLSKQHHPDKGTCPLKDFVSCVDLLGDIHRRSRSIS